MRAVRPDTLTVNAADKGKASGGGWLFDTPLALRRHGKLVGLLMPVRLNADGFREYDLGGEPVDLADVLEARSR